MEEWKQIPKFTNYEASTLGRLKTYNWKNKGVQRIMKPAYDANGYLRTMLKGDSDGKFHTIKVMKLNQRQETK